MRKTFKPRAHVNTRAVDRPERGQFYSVWEAHGDQLIEMRRQGRTLQQIGEIVGVTKQRVKQILQKHCGKIEPAVCCEAEAARRIGCSRERLVRFRKQGVVNPERYTKYWLYTTDDLDKAKIDIEAHPSQPRQRRWPVTLHCLQCGREFVLSWKVYNSRAGSKVRPRKVPGFFCSRQCYGKYFGQHYGFTVHPEHSMAATRNWDYSKVYSLWEETGWSQPKLSETLGMPIYTIGYILRQYPAYVNRPRRRERG